MGQVRTASLEMNVVDRGSGPALLLVHGFPLDHTMWQRQIDEFAGDYRVIAADLRGFGGSRRLATDGSARGDNPTNAVGGESPILSMDQFADDLAGLLDILGIDQPVTFCGLSMGGYVAWQFWRRHRRRIGRMILCDTRAVADSPAAARMRLAGAERVMAEGVGFLADGMADKLFAPITARRQPQLVEEICRVMRASAPASVAAAMRGLAARPDSSDLLTQIDVPTLVVCGQHDSISTVAEMRGMAGEIASATFVEVPDAGHLAPLENPTVANRAIREFLVASGRGVHRGDV